MTKKRKWKYTRVRQWEGDDGYCWAVFIKGQSRPRVCGLTRSEVAYYRERFEKEEAAKHASQ